MTCAGIIFSNLHDRNVAELTKVRTMASVPFAGGYRLIDFPLSNMIHAGIRNISVIAHDNYHSLMEHIGSGKDWDLACHTGGIRILPPYATAYASPCAGLYTTRLEALKGIVQTVLDMTEEQVVLSDCDVISNIDLSGMLREHEACDADVTMVVKQICLPEAEGRGCVYVLPESDENGTVTDVYDSSANIRGYHDVCMNIWIMKRRVLAEMILDAIAHEYTSFQRDVILRNLSRRNIRITRWDGYYACIGSMADYFERSMAIAAGRDDREALFRVPGRPIFTKMCNFAPTYYGEGAEVSDSLIADGCVINGTVENSVLFPGVRIGAHTTVRNSVLFQDSMIGENVQLDCVVSDKKSIIRDNCRLAGHEKLPFYIGKGMML